MAATDTQQPKDGGEGPLLALVPGRIRRDKETPASTSATSIWALRPHAGDPWHLCFLTQDAGLLAPAGHRPCTHLPPAGPRAPTFLSTNDQ